jgi:hypothetical protein
MIVKNPSFTFDDIDEDLKEGRAVLRLTDPGSISALILPVLLLRRSLQA